MLKKTTLAIAVAAIFAGGAVQAATVYEADNGDKVAVYGEVGVGGHIGANYEYGEFYQDRNFIDDSFATIGVKGNKQKVYYRVELDYQRENWKYGSGDMALDIDKLFVGYKIFDKALAIEVGLTDTAFDDYDKHGDLTFDTTVETGEAGDQARTVKLEGRAVGLRYGGSYSYEAESSSGSKLGDVTNAYFGYFGKTISAVAGAELRAGSDGESKYGEQALIGFGMRVNLTEKLTVGVNGYVEDEDIAQNSTVVVDNSTNINPDVKVYNDYKTLRNKGALVSARYKFMPKWEVTGSYNFEEYEQWAIDNARNGKADHAWGDDRTWGTVGINYKPSRSVVFAVEGNFGEAAQDAYAYARVYF